ncbi:MAG TPA: hypothetical protein VN923_17670, partial [Thermoanaerobaculia bacterium]|nr:hypothetical protein [Thermoanaerobaculia bacterium]
MPSVEAGSGVPRAARLRDGQESSAGASDDAAPTRVGLLTHRRVRPWAAALVVFAVAAPLLWAFYARHPLLYDTDSSYHLAVARAMAEQGLHPRLPAVRMSALTQYGFSDNVLLFHAVLVPFAARQDPIAGGRAALALLDAAILGALAGLGCAALGWWGLLVPLAASLGSLETCWRLVRLRPELLALLLLLLALAAAAKRRYRTLGALAALFALSYVAWHAFLGLFLLLFAWRGWARRTWDWPLLLYPTLGTGVGLLVHPAFPANLLLWKVAAWDVLASKAALDSGTELGPASTQVVLLANLGFWAVAAIFWRAREPALALVDERTTSAMDEGSQANAREHVDAFGLAALCFGGLYAMVSRFALYFYPLALLWLAFFIRGRGERIGGRVRLPLRGSVPTWAALALAT